MTCSHYFLNERYSDFLSNATPVTFFLRTLNCSASVERMRTRGEGIENRNTALGEEHRIIIR
jgi:hypothetical protein